MATFALWNLISYRKRLKSLLILKLFPFPSFVVSLLPTLTATLGWHSWAILPLHPTGVICDWFIHSPRVWDERNWMVGLSHHWRWWQILLLKNKMTQKMYLQLLFFQDQSETPSMQRGKYRMIRIKKTKQRAKLHMPAAVLSIVTSNCWNDGIRIMVGIDKSFPCLFLPLFQIILFCTNSHIAQWQICALHVACDN